MRLHRSAAVWLLVIALSSACAGAGPTAGPVDVKAPSAVAPDVPLPNRQGSLKFGVLGDFGTGDRVQYQMAEQMAKVHATFRFEFVTTVGDNLYGGHDYQRKFEMPYKALLDAGVKFYASLGNHDQPDQRLYKLFNMDGQRYYTFKPPTQDVRFFALDSTYLVPEQIKWFEAELQKSNEAWKIAYFHHPPYSSGERHGSNEVIREALEPLFIKYNISVVLTGHDHFYERIKPQNGIVYFVVGAGGKLRRGNIDRTTGLTARGFDTDLSFMVAEIDGDEMVFNAVSRLGRVVDSGTVTRRKAEKTEKSE